MHGCGDVGKIERIFPPWQTSSPRAGTTQAKGPSRGGRLRVALKKASIKRVPEPLAPKRNNPRKRQRKNNGAKSISGASNEHARVMRVAVTTLGGSAKLTTIGRGTAARHLDHAHAARPTCPGRASIETIRHGSSGIPRHGRRQRSAPLIASRPGARGSRLGNFGNCRLAAEASDRKVG
jgi:hypothetical protein